METRDKNIFRPPRRLQILYSMRDKSCYCANYEDYGHITNDCKSLYEQIMFTIKKGGLTQYLKKSCKNTPIANPSSFAPQAKGKEVVHTPTSAEQNLRMVLMIVGSAKLSKAKKQKSKQERRIEERAKCLHALGHTINFMSALDKFYPTTPIVFME